MPLALTPPPPCFLKAMPGWKNGRNLNRFCVTDDTNRIGPSTFRSCGLFQAQPSSRSTASNLGRDF